MLCSGLCVQVAASPMGDGERLLNALCGHRPTRGRHGQYRRKRTSTCGAGRGPHPPGENRAFWVASVRTRPGRDIAGVAHQSLSLQEAHSHPNLCPLSASIPSDPRGAVFEVTGEHCLRSPSPQTLSGPHDSEASFPRCISAPQKTWVQVPSGGPTEPMNCRHHAGSPSPFAGLTGANRRPKAVAGPPSSGGWFSAAFDHWEAKEKT
jgi:hypothetical protein